MFKKSVKEFRDVFFTIFLVFLRFISRIIFGLSVNGFNNVPRKGSLLIASNHISNLDPVIAGISSPRELSYMAKKELFRNFFLRNIIRFFGAFPINREGIAKDSFENAFKILRKGGALLMFPEGTRGDGTVVKAAKPGVGMIVYKTKPRVVPLIILGTNKILPKGSKSFHFSETKTFFGKPMDLERFFTMPDNKETYNLISVEITLILNNLLKTSVGSLGSR